MVKKHLLKDDLVKSYPNREEERRKKRAVKIICKKKTQNTYDTVGYSHTELSIIPLI